MKDICASVVQCVRRKGSAEGVQEGGTLREEIENETSSSEI